MSTTDQQLGAASVEYDNDGDDAVQRIWHSGPMTTARRVVVSGSEVAMAGVATGARWMGRSVVIAPHAVAAGATRTAEVARDDWRRRENQRNRRSSETERIDITVTKQKGTSSPSAAKPKASKAKAGKPSSG